jgi:exodeoxyribonuclease VII large subunit
MHRTGSETLSVSRVLELLKVSLVRAFPSLCVSGEVVDPFMSRGGHFYMRLRDRGGELKVVMWRREAQRLRRQPVAGDKVLVRGSLTIFPSKGDLQLQALALAWAGQGDKLAELAELKEKLRAEGLLDRPKRELPFFPRRVGVVTSIGSAVLHDIFQCLRRRNPAVELWLAPSAVSGPEAGWQLRRALRHLQGRSDVVIVARGGGSFEELLPFSDEELVRAAAGYPVPVISAIGHGSDSTLLDLVADANAATPTAAAELATPLRDDLLRAHEALRRAAGQAMQARLRGERRELSSLSKLCASQRPNQQVLRSRALWERLESALRQAMGRRLEGRRSSVASLQARLDGYPWSLRLQRQRQDLDHLEQRLQRAIQGRLGAERQRLQGLRQLCLQLGPGAVLKRGFAMLLSAGIPVTTAAGRMPGEELELLLADGSLTVTVTSVDLDPHPQEATP